MVKVDRKARENLYRAILELSSVEECRAFFEDIASIRELDAMSQRWEVAYMLDNGKNYQEISTKTGASTATISRVNKCLQYGSDGYRTVLDKMKEGD
jgi:TrpR-related protein YerC/YecD